MTNPTGTYRSLGAKLDSLDLTDDEASLLDAILDHLGADEVEVEGFAASGAGPYSLRLGSLSASGTGNHVPKPPTGSAFSWGATNAGSLRLAGNDNGSF